MPGILALLLVLLAAASAAAQPAAPVDFVLHGARIHTVDPERPRASALAVGGGRIVAVGETEELLAAYPAAERVDAAGLTVVPGLIDAHAHLMGLGEGMLRAELVGAASLEETLERLVAFERTLPDGAWLVGRGWDQNDWPVKRFPTRHDLDRSFPDRPVWLRRIDGHAGWANTAALRAAGVSLEQPGLPDPPGGRIVRDALGQPTGVFVDAAMALVDGVQPPDGPEQRERALQLALRAAARHGLTGVHDAGVDLRTIRLYQRAIDADRFDLRVYAMIDGAGQTLDHFCANGPLLGYGDRLTVRSVKLYADGALGSRGAALLDDYADDPHNRGLLVTSPERLEEIAARAMRCGLQVNTHAIGDRGNRVVLDAYELALRSTGNEGGRHRIEHAQVVAPADFERFAALGVVASVQPTHATSDMYWAEERVGPERIAGAYAWRRLLDVGARIAFGSDFPVERVSPLLGFYAAVTRQDAEGRPVGGWRPAERLTREEALRGFTLDAAYAAFQEDEVGSLAPGKRADFVLLSHDILTVPAPDLLRTRVVATYLGGRKVYEE